jgi:predicted NBD/HSP70 family sugar kinase
MDVSRILSEIDAEIARLQQARSALIGISSSGTVAPRRGRPKGSVNVNASKPAAKRRKRNLSPEGRKRIAEAMKRRWAERRASTKGSGKKESSK